MLMMFWEKQLWRLSSRFVLFVVYFSLFLDNMLLTIVVPIMPDVLYHIQSEENKKQQLEDDTYSFKNSSTNQISSENEEIGILFASKAIVQLLMNPIVGPLTNRLGSSIPMFFGTIILMISSLMFSFGETYALLFAARSIQGVGSACICIAGMATIADRYPEDEERSKVMGIAMGGMAAGVLVGYPFGSIGYDLFDKRVPLLVVSFLLLLNSVLLFVVLHPRVEPDRLLVGSNILRLVSDPYILFASGAICVSTFSIAVLEPCLPIWLMESMSPPRWQLGTVFIPDSLGYLIGTHLFGSIAYKFGRWLTTMISLLIIGICTLSIPLTTHILELVIPHFGLGLGIGIVDASLMPLLAYLVDSRHVALYGTIYAVAQVAVCLAYSVGPLFGGYLVKEYGFSFVMKLTGTLNLIFSPFCYFLKNTPVLGECTVPFLVVT
nr:synaptic vesicular amine transporter-like [Parasteatoda tepidariorum]